MLAVRFHQQGPPSVLCPEELPDPVPGPGEVLLDVRAASVNHLDIWVRRTIRGVTLPRIPGADAAGVVLELGSGVGAHPEDPKVGDAVLIDPGSSCGRCRRCAEGEPTLCRRYGIRGESGDGTYVTRLTVPAASCLPFPQDWSFAEAAAFPLVAMTAWRMLIPRGQLRPGEDVLILGAAAGVGVMAIQVAKLAGCRVLAAASSPAKRALCEELGADVVFDHTQGDWVKTARALCAGGGPDVVVDYVGKETWGGSLRAVRPGGRVLTCGATTGHDPTEDLRQIFFRQVSVVGSTMASRAELAEALDLARLGRLRPVIGERIPLLEAARAHELVEARAVSGKIVLEAP
jgi:NADPH:quinone reductase-like Zn-dependent oxidoreductase